MPITIDQSQRPIVRVVFEGRSTDAEFDAYLRELSIELLAHREKTVTILDTRAAAVPSASQRRKQGEWLKAYADDLRRYSLGTAFVVRSTIVRGALTAAFWLTPVDAPQIVVATLAEALRWAVARARAAGLTVPRAE